MKLDEKIITYFESCNSPVDKEGYLCKKVRNLSQALITGVQHLSNFGVLH